MTYASTSIPRFNIGNMVRATLVFPALRAWAGAASAIAPGWLARTAARRFITPPSHSHTAAEIRALQSAQRLSVASPMGQLTSWRFGDRQRPVVIASHGWGGRGAQFREFVPALLDAGFQVWLFDNVGHGESDGHEAPITDLAQGVASIVRAAEAEGATVAGLIGHSFGSAAIGIALRNELKDLTSVRVVQIAPPGSLIRYSHSFARMLGLPERVRAAMQWRLEQKIGRKWQEFELPGALERLQVKALVIHDEHDAKVRIEDGLAVARAWPDARFKRTQGLGHGRILHDPEVIAAAVDFLADRVSFPLPPDTETPSLPRPAPLY
jgi:pimeloyl-ACP methyl ester carboxylesterase